MAKTKAEYVPWIPKAQPSDLFPFAYSLKWVKTIEELKELLSQPCDYMGFDTETTGLNAEEIDIVGYSFCLDGKTAYYVPVWHFNFSLGEEALDLIYDKMCNTKTVAMFNMRYDVRVMEYHGYTKLYKEIVDSNMTDEEKEKAKLELSYRPFIKYDMTKVNVYDVQAVVYLADTNIKYPSLKASEEWYLGWRGTSFEQTVAKAENPDAITLKKDTKTGEMVIKDMNFFYLTPEEAYEYAAVDALGTYLLGIKCKPFYDEAKFSGQLDVQCLMPLERFENELTLIDVERLKKYSENLSNKINEVENRCWATAGRQFNLGSNKETNEVLKSLNIHTGITTKNGAMSTSKDAIQKCLEKLDKHDPSRQFLLDLTNYGTYVKQKSSYIDNIIEMAESNEHHKNRLRFSYKTTEVPSGRLAAGGDKKNQFFASVNIQNITKPHVTNHYCVPEDIVKQYYPEIDEALNNSGTREECSTPLHYLDTEKLNKILDENGVNPEEYKVEGNRWSYRIFGWVFSEQPWLIPGVQEYVVEGFIQDQNIRSCFLPDDNYYWVSLDFNAEEIRIPALWSREPAWVNAFSNGQDVHKSCYSLDTEFLTPSGFKTYDKIGFDDLIAQYDEDKKQVTWVKAGHKYFNESKEMYHFQGNNIDLLVTPNHRMYFKGKNNWFIRRADEVVNKKTLTFITSPELPSTNNIEEYIIPKSVKKPSVNIPIKTFMELMGYLLTDGGTCLKNQGQKIIYLSQSEAKLKVLNKIQELNKNLNYLFTERIDNNMSYVSNIGNKEVKKTKPFHRFELAHTSFYDKIVEDFGGPLKKDRRLPSWFKELPSDLLQIFLNAYIDGDGSRDKRDNRKSACIYVPNKQMLDDLQYICIKLGYSTNIETRVEITGNILYRLNIVSNRREVKISNNNTELVKYDKPIKSVCFAVPTGLLVVRRNGKVSVCGNTAVAIWGEENYSKDKRKLAKGANFGLLYGMTAHNFKDRFNMTMEEAEEFVDAFKSGLPTLFNWVAGIERLGEQNGTVYTMFGRPRRVKSWFDTGEWGWVNFAKRTCVNTVVQGTGADILKIVMLRIFNKWYNNKNTGPLTKLIRFKSTIHDEINYQVIKDKKHNYNTFKNIVKETIKSMRVKMPEWPFPMEVGLSIGNRWGQSVDFEFDPVTLDIVGPKKDEMTDKDLCLGLGIRLQEKQEEVVETPEEDYTGMEIYY